MRILIADDQAEVRSALSVLLEHETVFCIIGEADDIDSLLSKTESDRPGVILLDWELSGKSMAGFIPELRRNVKELRIVAMSVRPEAAKAAMEAGADAFISKCDNSDKLLKVIRGLKD